nr:protein kinase [Pyrinomonadaceae bacterium]
SYSEIYVARDVGAAGGAPSSVVIKALNTSLQGTPDVELERTLVENFRNEALALDRVRHPHIISRLGHGTALDLTGRAFHYLVLEYMPGGDMSALCRHHPLSIERALFYLEQVCAGLAHAHASGVIHRDIKPQNLLLSTDKRIVKIADFGVAKIKLIEAAEGIITRVGTDVYAPPEHHPLAQTGPLTGALTGALASASASLTPAADIYSLAKTTFMLLTGDSPRRFSKKAITELPPPVNQQSWAENVLNVLRRATQSDARARYQTVEEFWHELHAAHQNSGSAPAQENGNKEDSSATFEPKIEASVPVVPQALPDVIAQPEPAGVDFVPREGRAVHPRIVVPVAEKPKALETPLPESPKHSPVFVERRAQRAAETVEVKPNQQTRHSKPALAGRFTRLFVSLLLIITFAAMLLALHNYVSRMSAGSAQATNGDSVRVGGEYLTTTDVNLRRGAGRNNDLIGIVKAGSLVRVKSIDDNWCDVSVVQHAVPKDPNPADAGWMSKTSSGRQLLRKR